MFRHLLISTDLSDGLGRLVNFVPSLVAGGAKQVTFLNVVPLGEDDGVPRINSDRMAEARDYLSKALEHSGPEVEVKVAVQSGRAVDVILKTLKQVNADVLILGTMTRSLLNEKLFGSTTVNLCQRTAVPLLSIRPQLVSTYTTEELDLRCRHLFRCLLIPYDGSNEAKAMIDQVKQYLQNNPEHRLESCVLSWVIGTSGIQDLARNQQRREAEEALTQVKGEFEALGLKVDTVVCEGNSVVEVLAIAQERDISAIVVSSNNVGKIWELSVPSFAGELLRRSWHPVLFLPPKR